MTEIQTLRKQNFDFFSFQNHHHLTILLRIDRTDFDTFNKLSLRFYFKGTSPANSGSVFFDESVPEKISVQQLTTPESIKLDLLLQTKSLSEKVK